MEHSPKSRLLLYLKAKRLSQNTFAKICCLNSSVLTRFSESSSSDTLKKIEQHSDVNIDWLMTGEGEMLRRKTKTEDRRSDSRLIPFYDAETTGGYDGLISASDMDSQLKGYIYAGGWFDNRETAAIRHVGDSMVEYPNGCILAVREVTERRLLVPGKNYVIETSEYRVTKRVQLGSTPKSIVLYSTNEEKYEDGRLIHEPFEVYFEDIRRIFSVLGYIVNESGEIRIVKP